MLQKVFKNLNIGSLVESEVAVFFSYFLEWPFCYFLAHAEVNNPALHFLALTLPNLNKHEKLL